MSPVWVYPVIITPKRSSNEIRLNVDMREANKATGRDRTQRKFHTIKSDKETWLKRSRLKSTRTRGETPGKAL